MVRLNVDLQRVNGLIAQNSSAREALKVKCGEVGLCVEANGLMCDCVQQHSSHSCAALHLIHHF